MNEVNFKMELRNNLKECRINGEYKEMVSNLNTILSNVESTVKYFAIASNLANHLLAEFYEIICVDCLGIEEIPELEKEIQIACRAGRAFYCVELMHRSLDVVKNKYNVQEVI